MKKVLYIISAVILLILAFFAFGIKDYIPEVPSRSSRYHNIGEISVIIDGNKVDINNTKITYNLIHDGEPFKESKIKNGTFKFTKGAYGNNIFRFEIPNNKFKQVTAEFGHFNTNWWHAVNYKINIELSTNEDYTINANIKQIITYKNGHTLESENSDTLKDGATCKISTYIEP